MITDKCSACGKEYQWDACQDTYTGSLEVMLGEGYDDENREATIYYCTTCGNAIAIYLKDDNGASIFVPSTKEI